MTTDIEKPPETSMLHKALQIATWPLSITAGWIYGHTSARNSIYDTLKHTSEFAPTRKTHWAIVDELARPVGDSIKDTLPKEHARFTAEQTQFLKKRGLNNTFDYLKVIHPNERLNAAMSFFTAAGLTLGVLVTLNENKTLLDKFKKAENKDAKPER